MTTLSKLAQEKVQQKLAQSRQTKFVKNLEKKLPFEVKEEALKEIVNNILARAKEIREGLKNDPVATVKNYKALLDVPSLAPVKNAKATKKSTKKPTPKKALKKAKVTSKTTSKAKKDIH
ncbi:MAG: hypothetical protein V4596_11230 [Bdellovibrionota bacterium]